MVNPYLFAYNNLFEKKQTNLPSPHFIFGVLIILTILILFFWNKAKAEIPPATEGLASWYSVKSAQSEGNSGIWTASGERFNENAMSAAMPNRKLFGKLVKVTNLVNNKSIIIRVNDFGPSRKLVKIGRIIDLSRGAFLQLASLEKGLIKVKVEILN